MFSDRTLLTALSVPLALTHSKRSKNVAGGSMQDRVEPGEMVRIGRVAATHDASDRHGACKARLKHETLALCQTLVREIEPAELVIPMRIHTSVEEDQVRTMG